MLGQYREEISLVTMENLKVDSSLNTVPILKDTRATGLISSLC